jgi:N utilization substance protein B
MTTTSKATPTPGKIALPPRTAARVATVQGLYQMDLAGTDLNDVIDEFTLLRFPRAPGDEAAAGADPVFFAELLRGVVRIDAIVRAILRAGVFELMERPDVPHRVVINEYINVAHSFFSEDEPKVVNGVLDKLARQLRAAEFERDAKRPR